MCLGIANGYHTPNYNNKTLKVMNHSFCPENCPYFFPKKENDYYICDNTQVCYFAYNLNETITPVAEIKVNITPQALDVLKSNVCDKICVYTSKLSGIKISQKELDEICNKCILNKLN